MKTMSIEMLSTGRVDELWPQLEPMLAKACKGNTIASAEMTPDDIRVALTVDRAAAFVGFVEDVLTTVMVIQLFETGGHKGADVMALAGRNLMTFKAAYWKPILDWLRANNIEFLDAYVPTERATMYAKKFGFTESCAYVRMSLGGMT